MVGEGFAVDVAAAALRGVKVALLQHNLALADHHHRTSTHFGALEDVVLHSLEVTMRLDQGTILELSHMIIINQIVKSTLF